MKNEDLSKDERIQRELARISVYFEELSEEKKAVISPLLQNAAFMKITLDELQDLINSEGVIDIYQNGANQKGTKQSATLQSYNSLIKNYAAVTKTLFGLLPYVPKRIEPEEPEEVSEEARLEQMRFDEERHKRIEEEIARAIEYQRQQREQAKQ